MLSEKFKDKDFKAKILIWSFIIFCVPSYFLNVLTNKDPFDPTPYLVSALYFCPIINFFMDYVSCGRKILLALIGSIFIVTLLWLSVVALIYIGEATMKYYPFDFQKLTLVQIFLAWFFISIPVIFFIVGGILIWVVGPIYYLSDCLSNKYQFKVSDMWSKKSLGDFAINPFKLLLIYFKMPWLLVRYILRKFLGIEK
jgi:hypothetical protein